MRRLFVFALSLIIHLVVVISSLGLAGDQVIDGTPALLFLGTAFVIAFTRFVFWPPGGAVAYFQGAAVAASCYLLLFAVIETADAIPPAFNLASFLMALAGTLQPGAASMAFVSFLTSVLLGAVLGHTLFRLSPRLKGPFHSKRVGRNPGG